MSRRTLVVGTGIVIVGLTAVTIGAGFLKSDAVRRAIELQASRTLGEQVTIRAARLMLLPRVGVRLEGLQVGDLPRVTVETVAVTTGPRALLSRRVQDATILVSGAKIALPLALPLATTPTASAADTQPAATTASSARPSFTIASIDAVVIDDLELSGGGTTLQLSLRGALTGEAVEVTKLRARSPRTDLTATASLANWRSVAGVFAIDATSLDLDELMRLVAAMRPTDSPRLGGGSPDRIESTGKLVGTIAATRGWYRGIPFAALKADAILQPPDARLDHLNLQLFDGTFDGGLAVSGAGRRQKVSFRGQLAGVDLGKLAASYGSADAADGKLTASMTVEGAGKDLDTAMMNVRGGGLVRLDHGRVKGLDITHTVLQFLGATAPGPGNAFTRLSAHVTLADGVMSTRDLAIESADFELHGKGDLALAGPIDFTAEVFLNEHLSAQVMARVKELSYATDGNRVVLPIRIGGTIGSPSVSVDAAAVGQRAARRGAQKGARALFNKLFK